MMIDVPYSPDADMRIYDTLPTMTDPESVMGKLIAQAWHIKRAAYGFLPVECKLDRAIGRTFAPFMWADSHYGIMLVTRGNR